MSHMTIIYPNGMVEVINEKDAEAEVQDEQAVTFTAGPAWALVVLDEHFANHGAARVALNVLHAVYDEENIGQVENAGLHSA